MNLTDACFAVRRYRYIPDTVTVDGMTIPVDVWDTLREFEQRGGGDCDSMAIFAIEMAERDEPGAYYFVAGEVLIRGEWSGHAWVELRVSDTEILWADPTWGEVPQEPRALGYPATRRPVKCWRYAGNGQFDREEDYVEVA